jgi:UDP-3-O-[3-hydroxymyristoyl] N-acetylglucosamine deacetylase
LIFKYLVKIRHWGVQRIPTGGKGVRQVENKMVPIPSEREAVRGLAWQRTLKHRISCTGVGLHSGARVAMTLHPADPGTGVVFRRSGTPVGQGVVSARWDNVTETTLCTTIANDAGTRIATIEHLMAAFSGCGLDNVLVEIDGPEVPIMDGSAAPFVFLIECAGLVEQDEPRRAIEVLRPVEIDDGRRRVSLRPADGFFLSLDIDFERGNLGRQTYDFEVTGLSFKDELSRARTFGFIDDIENMRRNGYARGGSLQNAIVVGHDGILNTDGLRYDDEFVRHKALDVVGDLFLAGGPLLCRYEGVRAGHGLNNQLLRSLFADESAWRSVDATFLPSDPVSPWDRVEEPVVAAIA